MEIKKKGYKIDQLLWEDYGEKCINESLCHHHSSVRGINFYYQGNDVFAPPILNRLKEAIESPSEKSAKTILAIAKLNRDYYAGSAKQTLLIFSRVCYAAVRINTDIMYFRVAKSHRAAMIRAGRERKSSQDMRTFEIYLAKEAEPESFDNVHVVSF